MKLRMEYTDGEEEIIIRCRERSDRINTIETVIENVLKSGNDLMLTIGNTEYYLPWKEILFFETANGKVYAHTADHMYTAPYKLYTLETWMPSFFIRISKSTIANVKDIRSLRRELTGNGEITFKGCAKTAYFSRGYYHVLKDKIEEVRFRL